MEEPKDSSPSIKHLAEALCKAQAVLTNPGKNKTNPHFKSSYADLASDWEACRGPLTEHGLCLIQTTRMEGQLLLLRTILMHVSGEWIASEYPVAPVKPDPQSYKSAMTYARRAAMEAMIGLTPEDDDGNAASAMVVRSGPSHAIPVLNDLATEKQIQRLFALMREASMSPDTMRLRMKRMFNKDSTKLLTKSEIQRLFDEIVPPLDQSKESTQERTTRLLDEATRIANEEKYGNN